MQHKSKNKNKIEIERVRDPLWLELKHGNLEIMGSDVSPASPYSIPWLPGLRRVYLSFTLLPEQMTVGAEQHCGMGLICHICVTSVHFR